MRPTVGDVIVYKSRSVEGRGVAIVVGVRPSHYRMDRDDKTTPYQNWLLCNWILRPRMAYGSGTFAAVEGGDVEFIEEFAVEVVCHADP